MSLFKAVVKKGSYIVSLTNLSLRASSSQLLNQFHYKRCEWNTDNVMVYAVLYAFADERCKCKMKQDASKTAALRDATVYSNTVNQPNFNATLHMSRTQLI